LFAGDKPYEKQKLVIIFQTKMQKGPYDPTDVINANLWGWDHCRFDQCLVCETSHHVCIRYAMNAFLFIAAKFISGVP